MSKKIICFFLFSFLVAKLNAQEVKDNIDIKSGDTVAVDESFFRHALDEKADSFLVALDFTVTDANGKSISSKDFDTKLMLFDFSYLSCHPCIQSIPMLNTIYEKYKDKGLSLFWIDALDHQDIKSSLEQFKQQGIKFPVYFDRDGSVVDLYGIILSPNLFLVEYPSRKIIYRSKGYSEENEGKLMQTIDAYLK